MDAVIGSAGALLRGFWRYAGGAGLLHSISLAIGRGRPLSHFNRQALARIRVHDRQGAEPPSIGQLILMRRLCFRQSHSLEVVRDGRWLLEVRF